jgi:hypothetical protein
VRARQYLLKRDKLSLSTTVRGNGAPSTAEVPAALRRPGGVLVTAVPSDLQTVEQTAGVTTVDAGFNYTGAPIIANPQVYATFWGRRYRFIYQGDGNLVLYDGGRPIWASGTAGRMAGVCIMQGDGNLVIYTPGGHPGWASNTAGHAGARLIAQDDGNTVIYLPSGQPIWATNTVGQ